MAAKPKMTPEQWASIRATWEADPRDGYAWLVEELALPVSVQGVRKTALKGLWVKGGGEKVESTKVVASNHAKVPATIKTTMATTLPATMPETLDGAGFDGGGPDDSPVELSKVEHEISSGLTPKEERFVEEYLIDLNGTQAYKRVCPEVSDASAAVQASRLLIKPNVSVAVEKAKAERAARTGINADRALAEVWAVATADPRELVQVKVGCCRFCHGEGHQRQRTVGEMNRDREKHAVKSSKAKDPIDFDEEGGIGFNPLLPPHPECPECCGDGHARVVLMDSRNLSPQAAALYAGAKQGKHGVELLMQSKAEAQSKVFEHLGLNKKVADINLNVFPPREVLDAIYTKALAEAAQMEANLAGRRERLGITFENRETDE
ncbi:hypothetical protein BH10PSE16_BH10PSE16_00980 [soil metagenome]